MHIAELILIIPLIILFRDNDLIFIYLISIRYFIEYMILLIFSKQKKLLNPFVDLIIIIFDIHSYGNIYYNIIFLLVYLFYKFFKSHFNDMQNMFSDKVSKWSTGLYDMRYEGNLKSFDYLICEECNLIWQSELEKIKDLSIYYPKIMKLMK